MRSSTCIRKLNGLSGIRAFINYFYNIFENITWIGYSSNCSFITFRIVPYFVYYFVVSTFKIPSIRWWYKLKSNRKCFKWNSSTTIFHRNCNCTFFSRDNSIYGKYGIRYWSIIKRTNGTISRPAITNGSSRSGSRGYIEIKRLTFLKHYRIRRIPIVNDQWLLSRVCLECKVKEYSLSRNIFSFCTIVKSMTSFIQNLASIRVTKCSAIHDNRCFSRRVPI